MSDLTVTDVVSGSADDIDVDLNGECFIAGAEGEAEVLIPNNVVHFPSDFPAATDATIHQKLAITGVQMAAFLVENVRESLDLGRSEDNAVKIAFLRFLAARNGLISPSFERSIHNVKYNHVVKSSRTVAEILSGKNSDEKDANAVKIIKAKLPSDERRKIIQKFTNLVCCVAYIFRVRGHHYMSDFQDRYVTLWARCLYKPEDLPLDWQYVATDSLHAIMPDVLDEFWRRAVDGATCAGTLIKRFDSAPAGSAGVIALSRGLKDVMMLFPGVVEKTPESYAEFKQIEAQVESSRWGGSINARFYGAYRQRFDESKIGALASVVAGIYEHLAPQSKLRDSMALKRLAEIAPATGGAIGIAAGRAARDERLNLIGYTVSSIPENVPTV